MMVDYIFDNYNNSDGNDEYDKTLHIDKMIVIIIE